MKEAVEAGRDQSLVIVAEGAINLLGEPITCSQIDQVITERLHYVSSMSKTMVKTVLGKKGENVITCRIQIHPRLVRTYLGWYA